MPGVGSSSGFAMALFAKPSVILTQESLARESNVGF
jgi:hypothetical protein